ncbi:MAG: orotidine 5'-phosphate decarboxylase / HUMPS family protein [Candidatus Babeliaceae bacterium]
MKIQIAFDMLDLEKALTIARSIQDYVDIFEVGTLLIYKHGDQSVKRFKDEFSHHTILADTKIVDRSKDVIALFSQAGADWLTVMAGTGRNVIHTACTTAHENGKKIMLDLIDASSLGQAALEAKSLGVDALIFHKPADEDPQLTFLDRWDMVKGNTSLAVFISGPITRENVHEILSMNPDGIVLGKAVTEAENPLEEIQFFAQLIGSK